MTRAATVAAATAVALTAVCAVQLHAALKLELPKRLPLRLSAGLQGQLRCLSCSRNSSVRTGQGKLPFPMMPPRPQPKHCILTGQCITQPSVTLHFESAANIVLQA